MSDINEGNCSPFDEATLKIKFNNLVEIAVGTIQSFQALFNPPIHKLPEFSEINGNIIQQAIELITHKDTLALPLVKVTEFISRLSSRDPKLKSSEYRTIVELILLTGVKERPQYFDALKTEEIISPDMLFGIGAKFLQEFIDGGALDFYSSSIRRVIEEKNVDISVRNSSLKFIDTFTALLKDIRTQVVNEPKRNFLEQLAELSKILPNDIVSIQEQEAQWKTKKRQEFEKYVLTEYEQLSIFEPNQLRAFWEEVYRRQYGTFFYEIICESFKKPNISSQVHQVVRQIWAISNLDTINLLPQEARSRMPGSSTDGCPAANFGYVMSKSEAYQKWMSNSLARASGDIIVDAFHFVVDFGRNLNIEIFLKCFSEQLELDLEIESGELEQFPDFFDPKFKMESGELDREIERFSKRFPKYLKYLKRTPHEYDHFMIPFKRFLLEKIFNKTVTPGGIGTLQEVSGNTEDFLNKAKKVLKELQAFSCEIFCSQKKLVLGIGFNGELFESPNPFQQRGNEIWLNFSHRGRGIGGSLLLWFTRQIATNHPISLAESLSGVPERNFDKYKLLIEMHVDQRIKNSFRIKERLMFKKFMSDLKQKKSFKMLSEKFKEWVRKTSNWYKIPHSITVNIAYEPIPEEREFYQFTRELLLDALTQRAFSKELPDLMPLLFLHWKEILFSSSKNISSATFAASKLEEVAEEFKADVLKELDKLAWQVHPELETIWKPVVTHEFNKFMCLKIHPIEGELKLCTQRISSLVAKKNKNPSVSRKIDSSISRVKQQLDEAKKKKATLPKQPSELSLEEYNSFKDKFFEVRDVLQCVEPVFARVLGHDHFFPVSISKNDKPDSRHETLLQLGNKIPQNVILPCDKRCQLHALGHLYIGDLLSYQSADRLDQIRQKHGLRGVPDLFMTIDILQSESAIANIDTDGGSSARLPLVCEPIAEGEQVPHTIPPRPRSTVSTSSGVASVTAVYNEAQKKAVVDMDGCSVSPAIGTYASAANQREADARQKGSELAEMGISMFPVATLAQPPAQQLPDEPLPTAAAATPHP